MRFYFEIALVSFGLIVLEISYTRIFSFKLYYYFSYLIIALALLGLGTGSVLVSIADRVRQSDARRLIAIGGIGAGITAVAGYFVIARTPLNAFAWTQWHREVVRLAVISTVLFLPFCLAAVVIARILTGRPEAVNRLYAADLIAAALGCVLSVPLISTLTPPGCVMLSGLVFSAVAFRTARSRVLLGAGVMTAALAAAGLVFHGKLPDPVCDWWKTLGSYDRSTSPIVFTEWNPVFRVDVMGNWLRPGQSYLINHDGMMGSILFKFDGDPASLRTFETDARSFPFRVVKRSPETLIIGSAGGHEILASLYFGAAHTTGVELNPVTISLLTDHFRDFTGRLASNPSVTIVNAEGRSFLSRSETEYDLIWLVAPDTYAAMNAASAGAFVLSESYLYTVEMIEMALRHLTRDGILCTQFGEFDYERKPNRTTRYLATAREAFRRRGIDEFGSHVLVATSPELVQLSTVLLKATPFGVDEVQRFTDAAAAVKGSVVRHSRLRQVAEGSVAPDPVSQVITVPQADLDGWFARALYDVRPVTDDAPFFWHFARFRDALFPGALAHARLGSGDTEDSWGELTLVALLVFTTAFAAVVLLIPFVFVRKRWRGIPYKGRAAVYFATLALGFMLIEVSLIQMFTVFLGYPTYALSITMFALLLSAGIGSFASGRFRAPRRVLLALLVGMLAVLLLAYRPLLPPLFGVFLGAPLALRAALAVVLIAPLGFCLGAFLPIGLAAVSTQTVYRQEYVAWAWAMNCFFSVIGSVLGTILALIVGFKSVLLIALILYSCGAVALAGMPTAREQ